MSVADQDLQIYLDLVFSWEHAEETSWKAVFYTFVGDDKQTHFAGVAAQTKIDLTKQITYYRNRGRDVYVALGSQISSIPKDGQPTKWPKANRYASNIKAHKTLFADIDVGKDGAYDSIDEAYLAVDQFCADAGLPLPSLRVISGGGLHVYWVLDTPVLKDDWLPMAHGLKEAIVQHGLRCDTQCTVDASRVLRPPGTANYKIPGQPRPVSMYDPGTVYTYPQMTQALSAYIGSGAAHVHAASMASHPHATPRQTTYNQNFSANTFSQPATVDVTAAADAGCAVLAEAIDSGGAAHRQPLWNLLVLAASYDSVDPRAMAHTISDGHPNYTVAETDAMLERKLRERISKPGGLGWPTCKAISSTQAGPVCRACPHFARAQSPLHLPNLKTAQPAASATAPLDLPEGYWADVNHRVYTRVPGPKKGETVEACVLNYPILAGALTETGDLTFDTLADRRNARVMIPVGRQASQHAFLETLFGQGIMIHSHQERILRNFTVAWTEKLQTIAQRKRVRPTSLGWDEDAFSYGDKTFRPGGVEQAFYSDDVVARKYRPKGDLATWQLAAQGILGNTHLETIVASAFAAPLVRLSGQQGLVVSAFSPESGVGKTTALKIAQTVWASPEYMMQVNDTDNAVAKRMAEVRHLPVYYDELRMKKELDKVSKFIFQVVQGRDKNRLNANSQAQDAQSFQTMMVACSNSSLAEVMARADRSSPAGANRVLEFQVPSLVPTMPLSEMIARLSDLQDNYGRAGETYIEHVVNTRNAIKQGIRSETDTVIRDLNATTEDRFWISSIAVLVTAARLVRQLGLLALDHEAIRRLLYEAYRHQREHRSQNTVDMRSTVDLNTILHQYMTETVNKTTLVTDKIYRGRGRPVPNSIQDLTPMPMQGRLTNITAQYARDEHILRVTVSALDSYLAKQGISTQIVYAQLTRLPGFDRGLRTIASGTPFSYAVPGQVTCYDIPIPDSYAISDDDSASGS
jgi:hypothetical protein